MRDEDWGEIEEAFFAAGEAHCLKPEGVVFDAEDLAALGMQQAAAAPANLVTVVQDRARDYAALARSRAQVYSAVANERARRYAARASRWLLWQSRMLQLRLLVSLYAGAEHALRAVKSYAFHPRRVARRPWLARACIVVLVSSVSSYSAAAVLVASGAL
jgi:hypothetical protein